MNKAVSDIVIDILKQSRIQNNIFYLPATTLDRNTYCDVDKVLKGIGGKWNRKAGGHVFDHDPTDEINEIIESGKPKNTNKDFQFYPTPRAVAKIVCEMACINENSVVLEPSCGNGALADVAWEYGPRALHGIELNPNMEQYLRNKPYDTTVGRDFLQTKQLNTFDRIVMNPPFAKHQDIEHVHHAYTVLKPGGILVSVIGASGLYREDAKSAAFRQFLEVTHAEIVPVPAGAFKESGTMVPTYIIRIHKESI